MEMSSERAKPGSSQIFQNKMEEKDLLLDMAIKYKSIIEAKLTNKITNQKKDQARGEASHCVNVSALGYASRHPNEYKTKWANMLQRAKMQKAEQEISMRKTGGGPQLKPLSPCAERMRQHFGGGVSFKEFSGVVFEYDIYDKNTTSRISNLCFLLSFSLFALIFTFACSNLRARDRN